MRLFATCARGLEDVSAAEVDRLLGACATPDQDKVFFAASWAEVCRLHVAARTLQKVHLLLARAEVKGLDDVAAVAGVVDWAAHLAPGQRFGVRPVRSGTHAYSSVDVGRVVGAEVQGAVQRARGAKPAVFLDAPDVEVTALLRDQELLLGINLTGESLHRRGYRVVQHHAPLRPTLAAALLDWAGFDPAMALWDPMCGSGTLPIEAALQGLGLTPNPTRPFLMENLAACPAPALAEARARAAGAAPPATPMRLLGSDHSPPRLAGAAANAQAAGVGAAVQLRLLDATAARAADLPFPPDLVVVNPPYGLRIGSKRRMVRLYDGFLATMERLEVPRVVVLVGNRLFEVAAAARGLAPLDARDIVYGDLPARVLRFGFGSARGDAPAPSRK